MRVAPVSAAYMVNRYTPRKVRDQSERIRKSGHISESGFQETLRQAAAKRERSRIRLGLTIESSALCRRLKFFEKYFEEYSIFFLTIA